MLLRQLPDRSRWKVAETDGETEWGPTEHILAAIFDTLQAANWQRASSKKKRAPKPKPYPRPRDLAAMRRHAEQKRTRAAEFRVKAADWRARNGKG